MSGTHAAGQLFQLDRSRCLALLATQQVGRLVGSDRYSPIVVVNYALHGDDIVVRVDSESRVVAIVDTAVWFEVDALDERTRSGWSVIVRGVARDGTTMYGTDDVVRLETWAPGPKRQWIAIRAAEVTGRLLRGDAGAAWVDPRAYL